MELDCLFDLSTSSKKFFKADFHELRVYVSNYNDWTLLIDMNINGS